MTSATLEPLHPAEPRKPDRWLAWMGRLNILAFSVWGVWLLVTPPSFMSVGYLFKVLLPMWAMLACLSLYHLVRSPGLRVTAIAYSLAPVGIFLVANTLFQHVEAPIGGGSYGVAITCMVFLAATGLWAGLAVRRLGWTLPDFRHFDGGLNAMLAALVLFWVCVTLVIGDERAFAQTAREQETLIAFIAMTWFVSGPLGLVAAARALWGLLAPAGRGRRITYLVQLALAALLALSMAIPSLLFLVVFAVSG